MQQGELFNKHPRPWTYECIGDYRWRVYDSDNKTIFTHGSGESFTMLLSMINNDQPKPFREGFYWVKWGNGATTIISLTASKAEFYKSNGATIGKFVGEKFE
jgi:hypothetical protein